MTNLPPNMPPMPDPRRLLAKLQSDVRFFEARAERTRAALADAGVAAAGEHLTVTMLGSHVVAIDFADSALALSAPQLAEEVRRILVEGAARANHASAAVVREAFSNEPAAQGVEESVPDEVAAERDRLRDAGEVETPDLGLRSVKQPMTPDELEDLLDDVMHRMDLDDEPVNLVEMAEELDYERHRLTVPPEQEQARFEQQMAHIHAQAAAVPTLMATVEATGDSGQVEVRVNATGTIVATRFHAGFGKEGAEALAAGFMAAYAEARSAASVTLTAELGALGLQRPADASRDFGF